MSEDPERALDGHWSALGSLNLRALAELAGSETVTLGRLLPALERDGVLERVGESEAALWDLRVDRSQMIEWLRNNGVFDSTKTVDPRESPHVVIVPHRPPLDSDSSVREVNNTA